MRGYARRCFEVLIALMVLTSLAETTLAGPAEDGSEAYHRRDYRHALLLLRPPAEHGVVTAQVLLGFMYHDGKGVPQDYAQSARWFEKAADQGNLVAQASLATMYLEGQSVPKDEAAAVRWLQQPAEHGMAPAQLLLGSLREKSGAFAEALKWYRLAAQQNNHDAQSKRGNMYEDGRGVAQNYAEAACSNA